MPSLRARRALIALLMAALAAAGGRVLVLDRADATLQQAGFTWNAEDRGLLGARWIGLRRTGVEIDGLELSLSASPVARLSGVKVDVASLVKAPPEVEAGGGTGVELPLRVEVRGLDLYWEDRLIASELEGTLRPDLALEGPGVQLEREDGAWVGEVDRPVQLDHLSGSAHLALRWQDRALHAELTVVDAILSHPALASRPLPPAPLTVKADWAPDGGLEAEGAFAQIPFQVRGRLTPSPLTAELSVEVPDTPLDRFVAAFGELIPEGARATLRGTMGASVELAWPSGRWRVLPRAAGLGADGVLPSPDSLREGPITWSAPAAEGQIAVRTTGEGEAGWVPLARLGRLPAAAVAAEDSGFWTHPGYDLEAVQEALDAWAAGEERPRGGSTLTQQLAKNLFTDGERTLARKLRELLFTLELERRLGKARILELYLNVVELGPGVYGAGAASDLYFLKRPDGLSWNEAAFLAAILPAPRTFYETAYKGGRLPTARIERVIDNLVRLGKLSPVEAAAVRASPLRLVPGG